MNVNFVAEAQYTNRRVCAVSDGGAEGSALSGEAAQQLLLVVVGLVGETLHDLGCAVHILGDCVSGDEHTRLGVLLMDFFTVLHFVSENDLKDLLLLGGLLVIGLGSLGVHSAGALDRAGAGRGGSVVEVGEGAWVVGPLVSVELDEVSIVFSGEGPNNAVGSSHF